MLLVYFVSIECKFLKHKNLACFNLTQCLEKYLVCIRNMLDGRIKLGGNSE